MTLRGGRRGPPNITPATKSYYDPMGLPGEDHRRFTEPEWLWTPAGRWLKQLVHR